MAGDREWSAADIRNSLILSVASFTHHDKVWDAYADIWYEDIGKLGVSIGFTCWDGVEPLEALEDSNEVSPDSYEYDLPQYVLEDFWRLPDTRLQFQVIHRYLAELTLVQLREWLDMVRKP